MLTAFDVYTQMAAVASNHVIRQSQTISIVCLDGALKGWGSHKNILFLSNNDDAEMKQGTIFCLHSIFPIRPASQLLFTSSCVPMSFVAK